MSTNQTRIRSIRYHMVASTPAITITHYFYNNGASQKEHVYYNVATPRKEELAKLIERYELISRLQFYPFIYLSVRGILTKKKSP